MATKFVNIVTLLGMIVAIAILQDRIAKLSPANSNATELQSWMTFFTLFFGYLGVTEVYDETQLMLLKPRLLERMKARRQMRIQNNERGRDRPTDEQSCIYDVILCGGLRRCILKKNENNSDQVQRKSRCIGLTILITLTLIAATVMELCHLRVWADQFPAFAPHYSEAKMIDQDRITQMTNLNWAKTALTGYVLVLALLLQASQYFVLPIVCIVGSPFYIYTYCRYEKQDRLNDVHEIRNRGEESAKKQLNLDSSILQSSRRNNQRLNQVGHNEEADIEMAIRESVMPINAQNSENNIQGQPVLQQVPNTDRQQQQNEMDAIEQLRSQSIDLRVNPVGMRRVLFNLKTSFKQARRQQEREAKKISNKSDGKEVVPLSDECPVCLVNFEAEDPVVPLKCNIDHLFHIECLLSWADHNYTCPICRQPIIRSEQEIDLYETMQQRNQMNQHEDALGSGVLANEAQEILQAVV